MQHHSADQLHVEVPHIEHAPASLADHGEGLFQRLIQDLGQRAVTSGLYLLGAGASVLVLAGAVAICIMGVDLCKLCLYASAKLVRLGSQFRVAQFARLRLQRIDALHPRLHALDHALVGSPKHLRHQLINQASILIN